MQNILLLASTSKSRQKLLTEAGIPFKLVKQDADEKALEWKLPLSNLIKTIAIEKMNHVVLASPKANESHYCFVLTADTMGLDDKNNICGKPKDKQDAIRMIKSYANGAITGTAFCLDKKVWTDNKWVTDERIVEYVQTKYIFDIPDNWIERYFELSLAAGINYMNVSGAVAVEDFGAQFVKKVDGSYSTIEGLPMYELREALEKIGFFKDFNTL